MIYDQVPKLIGDQFDRPSKVQGKTERLLLAEGAEICNFPTDSCNFSTHDIISVRNFNFGLKFFPNGGFAVLGLQFWQNVPT